MRFGRMLALGVGATVGLAGATTGVIAAKRQRERTQFCDLFVVRLQQELAFYRGRVSVILTTQMSVPQDKIKQILNDLDLFCVVRDEDLGVDVQLTFVQGNEDSLNVTVSGPLEVLRLLRERVTREQTLDVRGGHETSVQDNPSWTFTIGVLDGKQSDELRQALATTHT